MDFWKLTINEGRTFLLIIMFDGTGKLSLEPSGRTFLLSVAHCDTVWHRWLRSSTTNLQSSTATNRGGCVAKIFVPKATNLTKKVSFFPLHPTKWNSFTRVGPLSDTSFWSVVFWKTRLGNQTLTLIPVRIRRTGYVCQASYTCNQSASLKNTVCSRNCYNE